MFRESLQVALIKRFANFRELTALRTCQSGSTFPVWDLKLPPCVGSEALGESLGVSLGDRAVNAMRDSRALPK
jgi:hypothetical protein